MLAVTPAPSEQCTDAERAIMREMPGGCYRERPNGITVLALGPVVDNRLACARVVLLFGYSTFAEAVRATRTVDDNAIGDTLKAIIDAGYPAERFERYFAAAREQLSARAA